ncbi:uncharacterized mitochondrial protein AtMg00810-like [Gossypium hirsutum]|uniref:Uncharacterized mitochondrial protein AtMg00810-like n=1 Tax=Gossypium hirsutum TaxID=3635 RepID=A0A1U8J1B2_GOSHI|nr:uncharacterized mitochondrial protein AtMg00810-like [Gossypium hirsutum]
MTDLGVMTYFLSMEVNQSYQGIFISQHAFALKILNRFCMANCKSVSTLVAQGEKLTNSGNQDKVDEKEYRSLVGCLLYLTATRPISCLVLVSCQGLCTASTFGYFFTLGSRVFCWSSKKQQTVAQSTAEAEYIVAATTVNQAIWLRKLLFDLNEE